MGSVGGWVRVLDVSVGLFLYSRHMANFVREGIPHLLGLCTLVTTPAMAPRYGAGSHGLGSIRLGRKPTMDNTEESHKMIATICEIYFILR